MAGKPGIKSVVVDSLSYREAETVWLTARAGQNVVLTLDLPIQLAAARALRSLGASVRGAVVVLDALDGDVLALVSSPAYDPNQFVSPIGSEAWAKLNDPKLQPMLNRATQGAYPPGSVFKLVDALACLDCGALTPASITNLFHSRGYYQLGRRAIADTAPAGDYDFRRALARSCNTYFIYYGLRAGRDRLLTWAHRCGLGERIGLSTRQETAGYVPLPEDVKGIWNEGNVANLCIGQEIAVTPLQVAIMTGAIANGGVLFWPRLVDRVDPPEPGLDDQATRHFPPQARGLLGAAPLYLHLVRQAMLADTEDPENGTAFKAFHARDRVTPLLKDFRVGAKTGTAQVKDVHGRLREEITWLASFGPYETPRYVVVVMVEGGGSGGGTCAPVAREVYQAIEQRLAPRAGTRPQLARDN